jgi:hypothetical protein
MTKLAKSGAVPHERQTLKLDWFLLRAIGNEVERRRTPRSKLALLVGTVVREFVPDVNKRTRELGMAYRDAIMYMFRRRKNFRSLQRAEVKASEHPSDDSGEQRLI